MSGLTAHRQGHQLKYKLSLAENSVVDINHYILSEPRI